MQRPCRGLRGGGADSPGGRAQERLRGKYRWHLLLKGTSAAKVRAVASAGLAWAESKARPSTVRVVADVDPVEVL
ncbi:MAG: hypothetical protein AAB113_00860 [Candidatus Eisenbacteria bacterium]